MLVLMGVLLNHYEPDPNGLRLDDPATVGWFAPLTLAPVLVGMAARSKIGTGAIAALHATSPLWLLPSMGGPDADLTFALLLWWFPLPLAAASVVVIDRRRAANRALLTSMWVR